MTNEHTDKINVSGAELFDAQVRDRVAHDHESTLFVEAGAGTGKTSELVARIIELVAAGAVALRDIAAITFTEAAAAELRERLHRALVDRIGASECVQPELHQALAELDEAAITTIHGFAQRILAEHPIEAGLPLRIQVLDEVESFLAFDRRFSVFLDTLFDDADSSSLIAAAVHMGVTPEHLGVLMRTFDDMWELRPKRRETTGNESISEVMSRRVDDALGGLTVGINDVLVKRSCCADPEDKLLRRFDELNDALVEMARVQDWLDGLSFLFEYRPPKVGNLGRKDSWVGCDVAEVRAAFAAVETERASYVDDLVNIVLRGLTDKMLDEAHAWALERKVAGELSFHDLLVHCRDLLERNERVRGALRQRFARIFIDEFQDTDPMQLEIVCLLGAEEKGGTLDKGRLFFVGDPKQSIYRFRGADAEVYEVARQLLVGGETQRLTTNFRSVPGLIDFVNAVFGELFGDVSDKEAFGAYTPLQPHRSATSSLAPVLLLGGPSEDRTSASERRARESEEVASTIIRAVADGWLVEDSSALRPARFGDVAVLVPRRTGLAELEDALDAQGVPYRLDSHALVYDSTEVRDLLACLRAVDERADESAIIAALRTPEFACSDVELITYRRAGGEWRLDAEAPEGFAQSRVVRALSFLRVLARERFVRGILGTLESIVTSRCVFQLCMGCAHPQDAIRRISFVLAQARAFVEAGGSSISELLAWMDLQAELAVRSVEPSSASFDEDAVRILTIHGAKGLEFPIVVLTELGGSRQHSSRGPTVLRNRTGDVEVRLRNDQETKGYGSLAADEETRSFAEELRLCYVAATRARDHLVISLHHDRAASDKARSLAEIIHGVCASHEALWRDGIDDGEHTTSRVHVPFVGEPPVGVSDDELTAHFEREERRWTLLRARAAIPPSVSASELATSAESDQQERTYERYGLSASSEEDVQGGGDLRAIESRFKASALGRVVHGILQHVNLTTGEGIDDLTTAISSREGCEDRADEARKLARVALRAPSVIASRSVESCWRELPLTAVVGDRLLECVIDLCYIENGRFVIVDYKTDAIESKEQALEKAAKYRLQLGAYALALSSLMSVPIGRCVLLFLSYQETGVEVDLDNIEQVMNEARDALVNVPLVKGASLEAGGDGAH